MLSTCYLSRASKLTAQKFTNELLHGVFGIEYLSKRSVTVADCSKAGQKTRPGLVKEDRKNVYRKIIT